MSDHKTIFSRTEKKYILSKAQYDFLSSHLDEYFLHDRFFESTICNIYYDTPTDLIIRNSLEKPVYKEKLRLRSYGVPDDESNVFIELKKKFDGIVYKRRTEMSHWRAVDFLSGGHNETDSQIAREIGYFMSFYKDIRPAMFLSYDRLAFYSKEDPELRMTFDSNITYRTYDLDLTKGVYGEKLLDDDTYIMELKLLHTMPLWLSRLLDKGKIYPASFSKYGTAHLRELTKETERNSIYV